MLNDHLRRRFGRKVYKLSLSTGCSCPNRDGTLGSRGCIFCDGAGAFAAAGEIGAQIAAAKARVAAKAGPDAGYIAYFQSFTNTYGPAERLRPLFEAAIAPEEVVGLSIATRPDCLGPEILVLLADLAKGKPLWVELGLQTVHPESAVWIRRGYDLPVFEQAVRDLHRIGAEVVVHQILGLPGETPEDMTATARYIGSMADGVKFHLLHVLRGTDMEPEWRAGNVPEMTLQQYTDTLAACIRVIPKSVVIHRLTGDGAKRDLLAPLWTGDKKRVLNQITRAFWEADLEQGSGLDFFVDRPIMKPTISEKERDI